MDPINSVSGLQSLAGPNLAKLGSAAQPDGSFKDLLINSIGEVNSMQQQADVAVEKLAAGEEIGTAEVLTAVQKADIAFRMMMQMRNKLVQAYQEVQNIRV